MRITEGNARQAFECDLTKGESIESYYRRPALWPKGTALESGTPYRILNLGNGPHRGPFLMSICFAKLGSSEASGRTEGRGMMPLPSVHPSGLVSNSRLIELLRPGSHEHAKALSMTS